MATNAENLRELFDRIHALEQKQSEMDGFSRGVLAHLEREFEQEKRMLENFKEQERVMLESFNERDESLLENFNERTKELLNSYREGLSHELKLYWRMFLVISSVALISLFAVIYGAIGDEGLKSVRASVPTIPSSPNPYNGKHQYELNEAIPWHDDSKIKTKQGAN